MPLGEVDQLNGDAARRKMADEHAGVVVVAARAAIRSPHDERCQRP